MHTAARHAIALSLSLAACSGPTSNPDRASLSPAGARPSTPRSAEPVPAASAAPASATPPEPGQPAPRVSATGDAPGAAGAADPGAAPAAAEPEVSVASAAGGAAAEPATSAPAARSAPQGQAEPDPGAPKRLAPAVLPIAYIEGQPLDVRRFLGRVWMRDSTFAREVLDQLVVAELAMREADRLGVKVDPARVDAGVQRALDALAHRLEEKGSKLSVQEHVRKNLGLDFELYKAELERDALMQLLAERDVRAFALASERAVVRIAELPDRAALDAFQAELAAGGDFAALVEKHGTAEIKQSKGATMTLFQNDSSKLSRLVFATPVGGVGGPLEEGGRFLLARVEERLAPRLGSWAEIGTLVEASLASDPVDDLEYAQWKTWVGKVYEVDLDPFLELVGEKKP